MEHEMEHETTMLARPPGRFSALLREVNTLLVAAILGTTAYVTARWGIPHIQAACDEDLFFGFGYAMARDRLFQLDYLRRKAAGRLAEVLGPEALEQDVLARTVGIPQSAQAGWTSTAGETRLLVSAFTRGINALREESAGCWPIEFDLLDYEPEPWSEVDCLAIETATVMPRHLNDPVGRCDPSLMSR